MGLGKKSRPWTQETGGHIQRLCGLLPPGTMGTIDHGYTSCLTPGLWYTIREGLSCPGVGWVCSDLLPENPNVV